MILIILIIIGLFCFVCKELFLFMYGGEMIIIVIVVVVINGKFVVVDMVIYIFLLVVLFLSVVVIVIVSVVVVLVIYNVCLCVVEYVEEDIKVDYEFECVYEEDGGSESEFIDDEVDEEEDGKDIVCF